MFTLIYIFCQLHQATPKIEAFFSIDLKDVNHPTSANISKKFIEKISGAKKRILIAIYTFTNIEIMKALVKQKAENPFLQIEVILDKFSMSTPSKIKYLVEKNIAVFLFDEKKFASLLDLKKNTITTKKTPKTINNLAFFNEPIMHNKYAIIDECLFTGSYNYTMKADAKNFENFILLEAENSNELATLEQFLINFFELKKFTKKLSINCFEKNKKIAKLNQPQKKIILARSKNPIWNEINNLWQNFKNIFA